ncbi:MarR family winged helix-turn-helix transcriptional regulator [Actinomadura fibrosa]|uniref:MarR family winged helix-turn-helix transcriptional regulator n=1 Tax=Actinomadura fibrosa TaxID=111802 RepID=A0ABW2XDR5_9ACTN|nr:MarR family transcriptional regulator [Actinomadura fibrosa]
MTGTPGDEYMRLDVQVCFALHATSRAFDAFYRTRLRKLGLTYPQYLAMLALWEADGLTVKRLGERLRLDSGTLSPLLKRMEGAGLVERRRSRDDERSVSVHLTRRGTELKDRAVDIPRHVLEATGLDLVDLVQLRRTLDRVTAQLDAAVEASAAGTQPSF